MSPGGAGLQTGINPGNQIRPPYLGRCLGIRASHPPSIRPNIPRMESAPKTTCTRCGTSILQITADLHDGCCMPCVHALEGERRPLVVMRPMPEPLLNHLDPAEDIILSVDYHSGLFDTASWVIQISNDGTLRQAMLWYRDGEWDAKLLESVTLKPSDFAEVQELITCCTPDCFYYLAETIGPEEDGILSLAIPTQGVRGSLAYRALEEDLSSSTWRLLEANSASFLLFSQLWRFADRHAPYRMREHEKKIR